MRLSFFVSFIPFAATFFATTAFAFPLKGYAAGDLVARNDLDGFVDDFTLRDVELDLYRRGKTWQTIRKILTYKQTPEEKERRKQFVAGHKEHKAIGQQHAKTAKKELKAAGEEYNVKTKFYGPHYAEHGEKAMRKAQKEWHNNPNLQQFRHADVSVNVMPNGRKHVTARYHNGGFHSATTQIMYG